MKNWLRGRRVLRDIKFNRKVESQVLAANIFLALTLVLTPAIGAETDSRVTFGGEHNCSATIDSPHPSGNVIKSHMRIRCAKPVLKAEVGVQLWRLRWWGWEAVGKPGKYPSKRPGKFFDTEATWKPGNGCFYYRSTGSGWVLRGDGVVVPTPGEGVNYDQRWLKGLSPGCGLKW